MTLQGLVLGILLCLHGLRLKSNRWLAGFIFVIAETTLVMELMTSGYLDAHPGLITYIPILRLALGPLIYFYVRSLVYGQTGVTKRYYLHFLPVIIDAKYQAIFLFYVTGLLRVPFIKSFYFCRPLKTFYSPGRYSAIYQRCYRSPFIQCLATRL